MTKDYQEIERIVEEFDQMMHTGYHKDIKDWLRTTLTTYGNAREEEIMWKVREGVPEELPAQELEKGKSYTPSEIGQKLSDVGRYSGHNTCRQIILDHLQSLEEELSAEVLSK